MGNEIHLDAFQTHYLNSLAEWMVACSMVQFGLYRNQEPCLVEYYLLSLITVEC